jgi:HD-GYP domain-containing protein (c-di-GMP phosphodiesterase class II)
MGRRESIYVPEDSKRALALGKRLAQRYAVRVVEAERREKRAQSEAGETAPGKRGRGGRGEERRARGGRYGDGDLASANRRAEDGVWLVDFDPRVKRGATPPGAKQAACAIGVLPPGIRLGGAASGRTPREFFGVLAPDTPARFAGPMVAAAFHNLHRRKYGMAAAQEGRNRSERESEDLSRIGAALSSERNVDKLLAMILQKARGITGADAGSIYLVEMAEEGERRLRFKLTQNDSVDFPFSEFTLPLSESSMAGYAALRGEAVELEDAYRPPKEAPFRFNSNYDRQGGYRTGSILAVPMKNIAGEVLGVLQLINCKRRAGAHLRSAKAVERNVMPFPARAVRLAESLASQAAVAYENSRLYQAIERLFDGFVKASVTAIEQRDPTTSGHSLRVSDLTVRLAETVDRESRGPYAGTRFTREDLREIRFAGLLHDFGKVGVREEVLVKAKKLYPSQLELVRARFAYIQKEVEARYQREKLEAVLALGRENAAERLAALEAEEARLMQSIQRDLDYIVATNEPALLGGELSGRLLEVARKSFRDGRGAERPYLNEDEVRLLSIPRGTLDPAERLQIESHVTHSFHFLTQIPWTSNLRRIPEIVKSHHEKLNGSGYPQGLHGPEIPVQTRMMTICDIFDALHAADRPYKKAVPTESALRIIESLVREAQLDEELFRIFVEARIYEPAKE